jgi:hypothetical protein
MEYQDKIDKEEKLIRLTVGQICSAGIAHNIYTGNRKCYAEPFIHKIQIGGVVGGQSVPYYQVEERTIGLAIRIANNGEIISNPTFRGNAIIAFLDKKYENYKIHTAKIIKVNRRSVNIEPIEYEEAKAELGK